MRHQSDNHIILAGRTAFADSITSAEVITREMAADLDPDRRAFVFQESCSYTESVKPSDHRNLFYAMRKKGAVTSMASTIVWAYNDFGAYYTDNQITGRMTAGKAFLKPRK